MLPVAWQLKQATLYPIIVLTAVALLVVGLIGFVFPRLIPMLKAQKAELPLPTRIILATSNFLRHDWLIGLVLINSILLVGYLAYRTRAGRRLIDGMTLRIPVVGSVIRDVVPLPDQTFGRGIDVLDDQGARGRLTLSSSFVERTRDSVIKRRFLRP